MKLTTQYPGDPPQVVDLMFGSEFAAKFPDRSITITDLNGGVVGRYPVTDNGCDSCNAEIALTDPCCLAGDRLYCWECTKEWVLRYAVHA